MKTNDVILWAGGAAAAYFAYTYAVNQLMIPDYIGLVKDAPRTQEELDALKAHILANSGSGTITPDQIGAGSGSGAGAGSGSGSGTANGNGAGGGSATNGNGTTTGSTASDGGSSIQAQLWEAAKSEATPNNGRLHFWAWNYYLPEGLPRLDPFTLSDAAWSGTPLGRVPADEYEVQNTPLTLEQYWSMVSPQLGLSGLRGGVAGVNHWGMQASMWPYVN